VTRELVRVESKNQHKLLGFVLWLWKKRRDLVPSSILEEFTLRIFEKFNGADFGTNSGDAVN